LTLPVPFPHCLGLPAQGQETDAEGIDAGTSNAEARRLKAEIEIEAAEAAVVAGEQGAEERLAAAEAELEEVRMAGQPLETVPLSIKSHILCSTLCRP
jgi:hypothetical protein